MGYRTTTSAATSHSWLGWIWPLLCLGVAAALWGGPALAEDDGWSRPEAEQSAVRWDLLSGYWRSFDNPADFVFTSRQGIIHAGMLKGEIYFSAGRWNAVRRLVTHSTKEDMVVVSNERWCESFGRQTLFDRDFYRYRDLVVIEGQDTDYLSANFPLDFYPPDTPLNSDAGALWTQFHEKAPQSAFRGEGPWRRIYEDQVPHWFRDLVAMNLIADNRCRR